MDLLTGALWHSSTATSRRREMDVIPTAPFLQVILESRVEAVALFVREVNFQVF